MKEPILNKAANVRIEWINESEDTFLIDGFVSPSKRGWNLEDDYMGFEEEQEILEVYIKSKNRWISFDINKLTEEEIETIHYALSKEYWHDKESDEPEDFELDNEAEEPYYEEEF